MLARLFTALFVAAASAACATGLNYPEAAAPRFAGGTPSPPATVPDTLLVVSFNVAHGEAVDRALAALADPAVQDPDVVLLQEMDETGTARMAEALGMAWVYYPSRWRYGTARNFGNAVLSRWPLVDDAKLLLPHLGAVGRGRRTATAATLQVGAVPVRVYSVHLATPLELSVAQRRDQLAAVLDDAADADRALVGGDLNSADLGASALRRGWSWPTEDGPRTVAWGRWDHILVKGFPGPTPVAAGTVLDNRGSSDHRPVWARLLLRPPDAPPTPGTP